jgi:hypothetical protein
MEGFWRRRPLAQAGRRHVPSRRSVVAAQRPVEATWFPSQPSHDRDPSRNRTRVHTRIRIRIRIPAAGDAVREKRRIKGFGRPVHRGPEARRKPRMVLQASILLQRSHYKEQA